MVLYIFIKWGEDSPALRVIQVILTEPVIRYEVGLIGLVIVGAAHDAESANSRAIDTVVSVNRR